MVHLASFKHNFNDGETGIQRQSYLSNVSIIPLNVSKVASERLPVSSSEF